MNNKVDKYIEGLHHTLNVAEYNHEIWWTYKEKKYRKLFLSAEEDYPLFFQTSLHAHFIAMVVALYRLFETRDDTINIPNLLKLLEDARKIKPKEINGFKRRIERIKPLWIKIAILRNKVFGHSTNNLNINPWNEARISRNDIKKLIKRSKKLLNDIS